MALVDKKSLLQSSFVRFAIVGCLSVVIMYGVYLLLLLLIPYNFAYTLAYLLSFFVNYLLTTSFTFQTKRNKKNGVGFVCCHLINYLLQVSLLNVFVWVGCPKSWVPIPVLAICVPTNFLLVRWVMRETTLE